ncbi:MAG: DUF4145 domain-containing protein [Candidatus Micrarchaeota archaeon]|nr:DUF4145 domain-containing protein [Candidatus Micrarchaeota archaeon]
MLSVRVRKSLKDEADRLGIDLKESVEAMLEDMVATKKERARQRSVELGKLVNVTAEEWANEVKAIREEE